MRYLRLILALYVLIWFNAVVPGHTRGIVTIPGSKSAAPAFRSNSCCSTTPPQEQEGKPSPERQRQCGVCFVAATYSVPVVYRVYIDLLEQLEIISLCAIDQLLALDYPTPFWPHGPPVRLV